VQATATAGAKPSAAESESRETAARLSALLRYVFQFDGGHHLRVIEESGLTLTQTKTLLLLAGGEERAEAATGTQLAEALGVSVAAVSRAVDGLVRKELVTRVEDPQDRRVRRVEITAGGKAMADELVASRIAGLETFVGNLTASQRRRLDSALEALLEVPEIAAYAKAARKGRRR
jgi:DNA-binding MarR family transcriptional regulator